MDSDEPSTLAGHVHTPRQAPARIVDQHGQPKPGGYRRFTCSGCQAEWLVRPGEEPGPELQAVFDQ